MRNLTLAALLVVSCGPSSTAVVPTGQPPKAVVEAKPVAPPPAPVYVPPVPVATTEYLGIDPKAIDTTANPCDDFYQYACGNWIKTTEIPADRSTWVRSFSTIDEKNLALLRQILEDDAAGKGNPKDLYVKKLGDFYAACMDEDAIEKKAAGELKVLLAKVDKIKTPRDLEKEIARQHLELADPLFNVGSEQDFKDATQMIGVVDRGGMGLPDRDYYLKEEGKFPEVRKAYVAHVAKMFELAGDAADKAQAEANTVLGIETALAKAALPRADRRQPENVYHRLELAGLEKTAPKFNWKQYWTDLGFGHVTEINVAEPAFIAAMNEVLTKTPMADLKTYLKWWTIHGASGRLSKAFVDENFAFYNKTLRGQKELEPRWKRCVKATDRALGEALGEAFVAQTFGEEGKKTTREMVLEIEQSMKDDLTSLPWMDDATRKAALEKLDEIANKIGYPDKWRNYDKLTVTRASYLANAMAASSFESHRELDKIGKPVDKGEFDMSPPTVNAYYNPSLNEMVFPAGILQPPFYDKAAVRAVNYGAIGLVMGHELTHGFDDEGAQFDGKGNLRNWWSPQVLDEFKKRGECVANQYSQYESAGLHLNGKLTEGENIADIGGLKLAYGAFQRALASERKAGVATPLHGGFTDEQLFFLGHAQSWCGKVREEEARLRVTTDPHSPPKWRINGPESDFPEFGQAWKCPANSKMVPASACQVW